MKTDNADSKGCVFNIQRYSLHDGPGIRTVVFLKGCPLRCQWCSNPESQQTDLELAYHRSKCIGTGQCNLCKQACSCGAIQTAAAGKVDVNRTKCRQCFSCAGVCPAAALSVFGRELRVSELMNLVEADSAFYLRSGGGLTLSGGEPLLQVDFVLAMIREAGCRRIPVTIETCGFYDWATLQKAAVQLKSIIYDIKCLNSERHLAYTGVDNRLILENFIRLRETFPRLKILARTPVIPGFNDSVEEIRAIRDFVQAANVRYELLPYHRLGRQKYELLGRKYGLGDKVLEEERFKQLQTLLAERG